MSREYSERPSHRLKLQQAVDHLNALNSAVNWWRAGNPCTVAADCEIESRKHRLWVRVIDPPDDPRIPLLLSDSLHCFRHALDHLAYRLAIRVSGQDPPPNEGTTEFPIMGSIRQFDSELHKKIGPKRAVEKLGLYAPLEGFQPYKGGNRELLGALHDLDNLDKHRFPPIVAGLPTVPTFTIVRGSFRYFEGARTGAVEPDTPLVEYIPASPDTEMDMNFDLDSAIAFPQGADIAPGQLIMPMLAALFGLINTEVFPTLEPFL